MRFQFLNRRVTALVLAAVMAVACAWLTDDVSAADIRVSLDGRILSFTDVQPQMVNSRVMLPFRVIGDAMGATVSWEPTKREVELTLYNQYVRLTINSPIMDYGTFTMRDGVRVNTEENIYILDSPAVIINDRTLVPIRAISEGFGGTASWDPPTQTAFITSPAQPSGYVAPTPAPDTRFDDSAWFETITGARAQSMYDSNTKFILVVYSTDANANNLSRLLVPLCKEAAFETGLKIYATDAMAEGFSQLKFIWDYVKKSEILYPTVFRVYGEDMVSFSVQPNKRVDILNHFLNFINNADIDATWLNGNNATPTPEPQADLTNTLDRRFNTIDRSKANSMLENGDTFVYVYYKSTDKDSDTYMERIKEAAIEVEVDVYGTDVSQYNYPEYERWWGNPNGSDMYYPTVYFISGKMVEDKMRQPLQYEYTDLKNKIKAYRYTP